MSLIRVQRKSVLQLAVTNIYQPEKFFLVSRMKEILINYSFLNYIVS